MNKLISIIKITRPANVLITFFVVIVAVLIAQKQNTGIEIMILAALSAAFATAAGNIINDIFDIETDKISHPDRVLVKGTLTIDEAWYEYLLFNLLSMLIAAILPSPLLFIVIFSLLLLYLYSAYLKKIILIGNLTIAFLTGMTFIYGGFAVGNPVDAIIPAVFAFLINLIREIVKDIMDLEGDKKQNIISLPAKCGIYFTKKLAAILSIILMAFTFYPFLASIYKIEYFIIVMIFVNPVMVICIKNLLQKGETNFALISNLLKLNMILGLIAIYLGN